MSVEDMQPLRYTEIGRGHFDARMHVDFLRAHRIASEQDQKVELTAKITVYPPDPQARDAGNVSYEVQLREPKYQSHRFTTMLNGGMPGSDGKTTADSLQA